GLGRGSLLSPFAERARDQLLLGREVEVGPRARTRPLRSARRDYDPLPGDRILANLRRRAAAQRPFFFSRQGLSRSIGAGQTIETLIPQGEVASSMIPCRIALIFSRSASSSSSWCWPSTERSVVCAICEVATMKFSTWTIAAFGSTIRKYATAFTRTGTLSFVITSCGGVLSVIVRRSTLTIWSTIWIRVK